MMKRTDVYLVPKINYFNIITIWSNPNILSHFVLCELWSSVYNLFIGCLWCYWVRKWLCWLNHPLIVHEKIKKIITDKYLLHITAFTLWRMFRTLNAKHLTPNYDLFLTSAHFVLLPKLMKMWVVWNQGEISRQENNKYIFLGQILAFFKCTTHKFSHV